MAEGGPLPPGFGFHHPDSSTVELCWFMSLYPPFSSVRCFVGLEKLFWNYPSLLGPYWLWHSQRLHKDQVKSCKQLTAKEHVKGSDERPKNLEPRAKKEKFNLQRIPGISFFLFFTIFIPSSFPTHVTLVKVIAWFSFFSPTFSFFISFHSFLFTVSFLIHSKYDLKL